MLYFSNKNRAIFFVFVLFFINVSFVFAGNPASPIEPGDNIQDPGDPGTPWGGCGPTDSNCYVTTPSSGAVFSAITPATSTNTINNANYTQEWQWNTLSGSGLKLTSNSTAASGNAQKLFEVALSGANALSSQTTYASSFTNTHTGSGTNVGLYATATGGTNNYAAIFESGTVGIGTTTPDTSFALDVDGKLHINDRLYIGPLPENYAPARINISSFATKNTFANQVFSLSSTETGSPTYPTQLIFAQEGASVGWSLSSVNQGVEYTPILLNPYGGEVIIGTQANNDLGIFQVSGDAWFSSALVIEGSNDGTDALTLTSGDILLSNGDFDLSGGDWNITLDGTDDALINKIATGTSAEEGLEIVFNATTGNNVDQRALVIDVASTNHNASTDLVIGLDIEGLASADAEGIETAIRVGTGWDYGAIFESGNVGIGDTTPDYLIDIENTGADTDIFALTDSDGACLYNPESGSVTVSCSSDERLKQNIVDAPSSLEYFNSFIVRQYNVIASGDLMTGVIAQEVLQTHPELVTLGVDGMYSVQLPNQWKFVKAIQELSIKTDSIINLIEKDDSFVGRLRSWLADINNGINKIFAKKVETEELCLKKSDGTQLCLNGDQLQQILGGSTSTPSSSEPNDLPSPENIPTEEVVPTEPPQPEETPPVVEEVPVETLVE
jgi:hypothetical protein